MNDAANVRMQKKNCRALERKRRVQFRDNGQKWWRRFADTDEIRLGRRCDSEMARPETPSACSRFQDRSYTALLLSCLCFPLLVKVHTQNRLWTHSTRPFIIVFWISYTCFVRRFSVWAKAKKNNKLSQLPTLWLQPSIFTVKRWFVRIVGHCVVGANLNIFDSFIWKKKIKTRFTQLDRKFTNLDCSLSSQLIELSTNSSRNHFFAFKVVLIIIFVIICVDSKWLLELIARENRLVHWNANRFILVPVRSVDQTAN